MTRVGIVGTGFMAVAHLRAYLQLEGIKVGALCNPSGRNLDGDFSDVHGNVGSNEPVKLDMTDITAYRRFDDLLTDESIDLIDITTPTFLHHEQALATLVRQDFKEIMGIEEEPVFCKVFHNRKSNVQYHVNHSRHIDSIMKDLKNFPGLFLAGSAYRGIGIPDCIQNGTESAESATQFLTGKSSAEI